VILTKIIKKRTSYVNLT